LSYTRNKKSLLKSERSCVNRWYFHRLDPNLTPLITIEIHSLPKARALPLLFKIPLISISLMSNSQIMGIRLLCIALGWGIGAALFGTEATWLFDYMKSYIWCGMAGGCIGVLLTTQK